MTASLGWIGFALVSTFLLHQEIRRLRQISLSTNDQHNVPEANENSDDGERLDECEEHKSRRRECTQFVPTSAGHHPLGVDVLDRTVAHDAAAHRTLGRAHDDIEHPPIHVDSGTRRPPRTSCG